jgi:Lon protease-like protein
VITKVLIVWHGGAVALPTSVGNSLLMYRPKRPSEKLAKKRCSSRIPLVIIALSEVLHRKKTSTRPLLGALVEPVAVLAVTFLWQPLSRV